MKVLVGKDGDIKEGRLKAVAADGRSFVVGRYKGQLFGMDGRCSHAGFDLAYGTVRDGKIICPAHGASFDVNDGKKITHSGAKDLRVYLVSLEGDDVYIEV
ncbi:MAG: Rieske (2Fe-2S) protein [Methanomassiliicoccales archaeon]